MFTKRQAVDVSAVEELDAQKHSSDDGSCSPTPSPASTVPLELDFESLNDYHIRVLSSDALLESLRVADDGQNKTVRCSLPLLENGVRYQGNLFAYLDNRCLLFHDARRCKTLAYLRVSDILQHFADILFHGNITASLSKGLDVNELRLCFMRMNYLHDSIIRAYSNYFTQLNHSSFMDTALDLDLVDCTSLYASLEAFSLANTLSGLQKFLCSELNMREEHASTGDMPTTSFCSSFFNSPEVPTLIQGMLACAKMFIVIGVGLDESFIAQTVAETGASISRKRKTRNTSVRALSARGEELLYDLWHTLFTVAPLVSTVKKRWSSSTPSASRQQDLQSIFEQSPQYIWVLQATANRIPKNDVRANELLLFFFRSPVTKNLFSVHPDLDSCKRLLSRFLLDFFAASCSSYRSSGLPEDTRNMLQLFSLFLSVRGVAMQLLMEPSTQKIVLDAISSLKNQVDRMSTAPRLLHLESFGYVYCGFCADGIGLLEACCRSRFIGARLKEAVVLHLTHLNSAISQDSDIPEARRLDCCRTLQKLSDSFCVETVSQSVSEVAAAIENVGDIDVHALLGQTDELPQDIIVRVDGKSGEHTVCGNDLMRFEGGKYSEKHIAWVRRTGGGGEPCPFVLLQRNVYTTGAKKRRFSTADVSICSCVSGKSSSSAHSVFGCGAWCMNRCSLVECTPGTCPCGDLCSNQKFLRCKNAPLRVFKTSDGRGWGIRIEVALKKDDFIIEYMGEVVGKLEYERRKRLYIEQQEKNTYFMQLQNDPFLMIDASRKSSIARFTNHSCRPNCYTQKWNTLGQPVIGIFAAKDIAAGTEVTIDYQMPELYRSCRCGAVNCKGNVVSL